MVLKSTLARDGGGRRGQGREGRESGTEGVLQQRSWGVGKEEDRRSDRWVGVSVL